MSREAMKLALEVMQNQGDVSVDEWIAAEKSLQKALAEQPAQQEPVAWRTFDGEGGYEYRSYDMNEKYAQEWEQRNPKHKGWVEPLYTPPAPCPTCEALARTVMLDQTYHDNISPQRKPLTDEEISSLWDGHTVPVFGEIGINPIVFARAIEAAHGIKE